MLLIGNEISPADWFRTWDKDANATLEKREFLSNTRRLFAFGAKGEGMKLWEHGVKATAAALFDRLAGEDKLLDIGEARAHAHSHVHGSAAQVCWGLCDMPGTHARTHALKYARTHARTLVSCDQM